jgi:hypothetical protein
MLPASEQSSVKAVRLLERVGMRLLDLDGRHAVGLWSDLDSVEVRAALGACGLDQFPVKYLDDPLTPDWYKLRQVYPDQDPVPLNVLEAMNRGSGRPWAARDDNLKEMGLSIGMLGDGAHEGWGDQAVCDAGNGNRDRVKEGFGPGDKNKKTWRYRRDTRIFRRDRSRPGDSDEWQKRERRQHVEFWERQHQIQRGWTLYIRWRSWCPDVAEEYQRVHDDGTGDWLVEIANMPFQPGRAMTPWPSRLK